MAEGWAADNAALTTFLQRLRDGQVAVAPAGHDTTPMRILLGDYLAHAGVHRPEAPRRGVRVELFANDVVDWTDFNPVDTMNEQPGLDAARGARQPGHPVRLASGRGPRSAPRSSPCASTASRTSSLVNWWREVELATLDPRLAADATLYPSGVVQHYDLLTFLPWLNRAHVAQRVAEVPRHRPRGRPRAAASALSAFNRPARGG